VYGSELVLPQLRLQAESTEKRAAKGDEVQGTVIGEAQCCEPKGERKARKVWDVARDHTQGKVGNLSRKGVYYLSSYLQSVLSSF
jgi:hypothetical protein